TADDAVAAIGAYGAHKVTVAIDAQHTDVADPAALAADLEARGARRIVYTDVDRSGERPHPNVGAIRTLADGLSRARVTVAGGVADYADLLALQALAPSGVDSVVVGRALYENAFPCQRFWCWQAPDRVDLSRFSTARLALRDD
ncbi:MAG: HisA/HisF-related TIM barrel protein, partial [Bacteroidota bacterium]